MTDGTHEFTAIQVAKNQTVTVNESNDQNGGTVALSKTADVPSFNSPAVQLVIDTVAPVFSFPSALTAVVGLPYECQVAVTGGPATFQLVSPIAAGMAIDSNTGLITWTPETEQVGTANVTIQATDAAGNSAQDHYSIHVLASNSAPVLEAAGPSMGTTAANVAIIINLTDFINNGAGTTGVTDPDTDAVIGGIALVGTTGLAQTGSTRSTTGRPSRLSARSPTNSALLLPRDAKLRYTGDGLNPETATITYHAWDATSGAATGRSDLSATGATGGSTAYSTDTDTASLNVLGSLTVMVGLADNQPKTTNAATINFKVVFNKPVVDFLNSTLRPTGTAFTNAPTVQITATGGDRMTFNVAVSGMAGSGTVILNLPTGIAHDVDGNPSSPSTSTDDDNIVNYDITGPTVTIDQAADQADTASTLPIHFTVTFSEPVTSFDKSDVSLQFLKYSVTDLGTLGGTTSEAYAINDAGQVVGTSSLASGATTHAFIYSGGRMIDIGALDASYQNSYALGINASGEVVGYGDFPSATTDNITHAFLYNGSGIIDLSSALNSTFSGIWSQALGINDSGQVVGYDASGSSTSEIFSAYLYNGPSDVRNLQDLGGGSSVAVAINASGEVVGYSSLADNSTHAFLNAGSQIVDLQTLGGSSSSASAINDNGDIVGYSSTADQGPVHAFLYTNSQMVDLGAFNGLSTIAYAINQSGEVVGTCYDSNDSSVGAFLYAGANTVDLNNLVNSSGMGWQLLDARGINDSGQIVGIGVNPAGQTHAFLLTPVNAFSGSPVVTVTPVGTDGTTYDVAVSGITGSGQLVATIAAGAVKDALGNPSAASTSTDNRVTYDYAGPVVTINQAATQINRTSAATIHFTVEFDEAVTDFTVEDVTLGGSALGNLAATVTGSGKIYDVAVDGMTSTGTVIATIAAGNIHDSFGNANSASTSLDNSVQFIMATPPTFRVTAPNSVKVTVGKPIVIAWNITNVVARTNVTLFYDRDRVFNGNEIAIPANKLTMTHDTAQNGYDTAVWDTTGMTPGTYYICGYLTSGTKIRSHLLQAIVIAPVPKPTFRVTAPISGSYAAGTDVTIWWTSANAPAGSTVSLCFDKDTVWNGNEKWIVVNQATALNTYASYTWNTTGMAAGKYYLAGYLQANGTTTRAHLTRTITVVGPPKPSFRVTSPALGAFNSGQDVNVYWLANNAPVGSTVSLCYDTDKTFNGNEHWVLTNLDNSQMPAVSGYHYATWNTAGLAPGKYYLAGYLQANGAKVYSHLATPITIKAMALMVDPSAPRLANAPLLTEEQLQPIIIEAEQRLTAATGIQVTSAMTGLSVRIVNLPGNMLGAEAGNTIFIDRNAAGYGWFVDPTPADDSEFSVVLGPDALAARKNTAAGRRVDLLTTVMHEMSHSLGFGHSDSLDLMYPTLLPGERRFLNEQWLLPLMEQNPERFQRRPDERRCG